MTRKECVENYLHLYEYKLSQGEISQNEFDQIFPIFSGTNSNEHHEEMAANYVSEMASLLMSNNSDLGQMTAHALAWEGLHNTTSWEALEFIVSPGVIQFIINANNEAKSNNPSNKFNFIKCD